MAFDQATRNRLARFVSEARNQLTEEFTRQLQHEYGLDPTSGTVTSLEKLTALDDTRWETASILRETMAYYLEGKTGTARERKTVLDRILREQAFTVLNRVCALRLAEARGLILQAVGGGYQSQGFQLYARLAGPALGETGEAYRSYLFSLFDEMAVELPPLFDRFSPEGRLFPRQTALLALLDLLNDPELESLWGEDETIGWIYQYFNTQEERRAMRAASQAPRNSRELAVRNQFFTPRYVVEFLADNTLGRIWYEMTGGANGPLGDTALIDTCTYLVRRPTEIFLDEGVEAPEQKLSDEELSQEELLRQPVYIPYRRLKDPREIKMLDPACGSMHFGLYAFDLFEQIYAESWDLEESLGAEALWRLADLEPLHKTYPDRDAFLRDVPRLIIEYNIHGIDIDPRAVQIAGLSLWLRAHKSWGNAGVRQADRPQIRKSNIVCAEPMPGDRGMLDDFLATLDETRLEALLRETVFLPAGRSLRVTKAMADALVDLVRAVWEAMELAGEAGSLLKIEETLREAIDKARKASAEKSPLFRVLEYDLGGDSAGKSLDFWDYAERLVLAALQDYAERAANGVGYRRRLFAGDAAQGFAFFSACRKLYDVILTNPPFGKLSKNAKNFLVKEYPLSSNDILGAFIERGLNITNHNGFVGAITARTAFLLSSMSSFREKIVFNQSSINNYIDLGGDVLDSAMVKTCIFTLSKPAQNDAVGIYVDLTDVDEKKEKLPNNKKISIDWLSKAKVHVIKQSNLFKIPGTPISYWASNIARNCFGKNQSLSDKGIEVKQGLGTTDDFRFVRLSWEIPAFNFGKGNLWVPYAKGGESNSFYSDIHLSVNWKDDGREVRSVGAPIRNRKYYFAPGLTYTSYTNKGFLPRVLPPGCIFTTAGMAIFSKNLLSLLALLNSKAIQLFLLMITDERKWDVGYLMSLPLASLEKQDLHALEKLGKSGWEYSVKINYGDETQKIFRSTISGSKRNLKGMSLENKVKIFGYQKQLQTISTDIDIIANQLYGLGKSDIAPVDERLPSTDMEALVEDITNINFTQNVLSYFFGCALGRWDLRYSTGEKFDLVLPDPFAPLPACPPGMLQNKQGLPATPTDVPVDYPLQISWSGILVDDPGHAEDIIIRTREALQVIWSDRAEAIETEACEILEVSSLREYFQRTNLFFDDHLKRYSKSRRYAPIYWPLSTPSGSYTLWLYYHRINDQILFTCVNDFVDPKLKQVGEDLVRLRGKSGRSRDEESELERLSDLERELKDFRAELLRVAAFWKPNLNDGVQITAAPLWRLFQHRNWQNKLKDTWEKLEAGEYDWAHLAHSIWPERVREKCKTDKSLAIAHDLEHLYVETVKKTKKTRRKKSGQAKMDL